MEADQHALYEGAPPISREIRQLTLRSIVSGMLLGGTLSLCNIYSGLKIGFTTNMSIASALLAYGLFHLAFKARVATRLGMHENVINQTTASAAASIAGAGLVAPIPALTMLTGYEFGYGVLCAWALSVSVLGVFVGVGLRRQMIVGDRLPFPFGMATAMLLREVYAKGGEALKRIYALLCGASFAALVKLAIDLVPLSPFWLPGSVQLKLGGVLSKAKAVSMKNLGFALDPSVLMVGVGALVGMRSAASMLGGAVVAWLWFAPTLLERGWVDPTAMTDTLYFAPLANWLLWPGAALMVVSAMTSFAWSVPRMLRSARAAKADSKRDADIEFALPRKWFLFGLGGASVASIVLQRALFDIGLFEACFAVALSFALAIVAGRVSGETGIAPIGAMGKITQLTFAGVSPGNATANLMSANVTGGAASQCSDMLHDLKTGHVLGAWPRHQAIAQLFGVLSGALAGSAGYLLLIDDPASQLATSQWPAPAVVQWKAVAELLTQGLKSLPPGAATAALIASAIAVVLATLEKKLSTEAARWVPSAPSIGLAFVIPAYYSVSVFIGACVALLLGRTFPNFSKRFVMVTAAGLIAGESLTGVVLAVRDMLGG